jgi:hypothetical protein
MGHRRGAKQYLVGNPEGQRPLGKPRAIWENNIKMHLLGHTNHSHDSRTTKWKKLTNEEPNRFTAGQVNMGLHR